MLNKLKSIISHDFLDILRGIAVIFVVTIHAGFLYNNNVTDDLRNTFSVDFDIIIFLSRFGSAGPMLFFVISGFLMAMLYFEKYESKLFFKRRIYRIMPMWVLFSIIASLQLFNYGNAPDLFTTFGISALIMNIIFLSLFFAKLWDFVPGGWSIQAEMVNYSLFHVMKKTKLEIVLIFQLAVSVITFILENLKTSEVVLIPIQIINTGAFWFFVGVILSNYLKNNTKPSLLEFIIMGISFVVTMLTNAPNQISQAQSLVSVLSGIVIGFIILKIKYINKIIVEVGKYSYGIYLIHFIIIQLLVQVVAVKEILIFNPIFTWLSLIVITTLFTYLLAKPIFTIFEKPFINKARTLKADR